MRGLLIMMMMVFWPGISAADDTGDFYCKERGLGSHFYCKAPEPKPEEVKKEPVTVSPVAPEIKEKTDPDVKALNEFRAKLVKVREKAVWNPSKDNVRDYMIMQAEAGAMARRFSRTFGELSWQEPNLSYVVNHPVDSVGASQWKSTRRMAVAEHMKSLNQRFGVYYFYSSDCPACHAFGPVLKQFSDLHGIEVMAISMDGGPNAEFPDWETNNGISVRLGMDGVLTPAVVLFDTKTRTGVPISYGMVSVQQLEDRIFILTGKDKKPSFTGGHYAR